MPVNLVIVFSLVLWCSHALQQDDACDADPDLNDDFGLLHLHARPTAQQGTLGDTLSASAGSVSSAPPDLVTQLPGIEGLDDSIHYAGHVSVVGEHYRQTHTGEDEELFYWFVGAKGKKAEELSSVPTVYWTNGGPGSSSFWGFFTENGPFIVTSADPPKLTVRDHAWNHFANYFIMEHPLDVTLSFAKNLSNVPAGPDEGAKQHYQAFLNFFAKHPELKSSPLVLSGESYAGTYIPLLAQRIMNNSKESSEAGLSLRGIVLGDAWVNPGIQVMSDTQYAFTHGMISAKQKEELDNKYAGNLKYMADEKQGLQAALQNISGLYMANIAVRGDPDIDVARGYLNRCDVRKAIHVTCEKPILQMFSKQVGDNYNNFWLQNVQPTIQTLLDNDMHVMVISGLNDAKDCNFLGTAAWLSNLTGPAAEKFHASTTKQWKPGDRVLGYTQESGNHQGLSWVKVLNAGHLAVMDQPLLLDWILNQTGLINMTSLAWPQGILY